MLDRNLSLSTLLYQKLDVCKRVAIAYDTTAYESDDICHKHQISGVKHSPAWNALHCTRQFESMPGIPKGKRKRKENPKWVWVALNTTKTIRKIKDR